jgi:hypothetical protein
MNAQMVGEMVSPYKYILMRMVVIVAFVFVIEGYYGKT